MVKSVALVGTLAAVAVGFFFFHRSVRQACNSCGVADIADAGNTKGADCAFCAKWQGAKSLVFSGLGSVETGWTRRKSWRTNYGLRSPVQANLAYRRPMNPRMVAATFGPPESSSSVK